MPKREAFELDMPALGAGCATMLGAAVVAVLALMIVLAIDGVGVAQVRPGHIPASVRWTGYLLRCAMCVGVGYVTARSARQAKTAHALILGAVLMLIGALTFIAPDFWGVIVWLLTLPLTLYGAQLALARGGP